MMMDTEPPPADGRDDAPPADGRDDALPVGGRDDAPPADAIPDAAVHPQFICHVQMLMWFHNMYINMLHRRCAVEAQKLQATRA